MLFQPPSHQKGVVSAFSMDLFPANQNPNAEIVDFNVASSVYYMDPSEIFLYLKCAVEPTNKTTETTIETNSHAAPVITFFHQLFDRLDFELNGVPFVTSYKDHPYKAFFNGLLNYSRGAKKTLLRNILWEQDTFGFFDDTGPTAMTCFNTGLHNRNLVCQD